MQLRTSIKALFATLSIASVLFGCAQIPTSPETKSVQRFTVDPGCTTFYVSNLSSASINSITINGASVQQTMILSGSQDSTIVCFTPEAVVVSGITCPYPNTTSITLPTGAISVKWTSNDAIAVIDLDEQS